MQIIFCADPMDRNRPDELYLAEAAAVKKQGLSFQLIDFEALVNDRDGARSVRRITGPESGSEAGIYRGWMMSPEVYEQLYNALSIRGIELINTPESFKHCHYLPKWMDLFEGQTPRSLWIPKEELGSDTMAKIMERLQIFGSQAVILKDYVKSEKHHWKEACFIPDASDSASVEPVVKRFLELRGDSLEGGLVFREFVNFIPLSNHSKSGMPLTKEFRLFVLDGVIVHWFNYWEEGDYKDLAPPIEQFEKSAQKVQSRFFTMDVAQTTDERWLIVELGDGQVAGLPEDASAAPFYQSLVGAFKSR